MVSTVPPRAISPPARGRTSGLSNTTSAVRRSSGARRSIRSSARSPSRSAAWCRGDRDARAARGDRPGVRPVHRRQPHLVRLMNDECKREGPHCAGSSIATGGVSTNGARHLETRAVAASCPISRRRMPTISSSARGDDLQPGAGVPASHGHRSDGLDCHGGGPRRRRGASLRPPRPVRLLATFGERGLGC